MGAIKNTTLELAETLYPHDPNAQDQFLTHLYTHHPAPDTLTPLTLTTLRTYWEQHKQLPHNLNLHTIHQLLQHTPPQTPN